ncbi:MAG: tetratricopeptide repeat protein [Porticoccaceae bacterium]|nr:tetratricopeptide repeat protein [Porticoccaceae bacterium]MBT5577216.1 tetratricopeptide repeat protein [Porticoccaceae bacterium]MBT7376413.1 tetratricopeptide repeat protein [Porticoccaceae bacterium]
MDPQQQFFKALSALREGDLQRCEAICETLLKLNPREVNSLRLRAQVWERRGDLELAASGFEAVLAITPDFAHACADLGRVQLALEQYHSAEQSLRRALSLDDRLKAPRRLLEKVLLAQGKTDQSAQIAALNRQSEELKNKVIEASSLLKAGDRAGSEKLCQEVLAVDPDNVGAKELMIDHALDSGRARWAEELSRQLIRKMPERLKWWLRLAAALSRQDKIIEAEEAVQHVLNIDSDRSEARMLLGDIFAKDNRFQAALEQYNLVLEKTPDNVVALSQKATVLKTLGEQDQAVEVYRRCMQLDNNYGEAAWSLSNLKTYRFSDAEVSQIQAALAEGSLTDKSKVHFNYALGKAYEHRKDWDSAFAYYAAGNQVQKQLVSWSADDFSQLVDRTIETFSTEFIAQSAGAGVDDGAPIFILGLPRSGSTLQEQILASHSQVEGTRELPYIPWLANRLHRQPNAMASQPYPLGVTELGAQDWYSLGEQFMAQAQRHRQTDAPLFTDKLPNNFIYIGLILLAMPNAKIVNTMRHPIDNCFGCFKQLWAEGQHFSYDLNDLGRYYRDYQRLMAHWQKVFPGKVYSVQYENVVDDLEGNVEKLLAYCGLPLEQACLRFHETERAVNTASSEQVRQPIYKSAVAYWKHFEAHLGPLKAALGDLAE